MRRVMRGIGTGLAALGVTLSCSNGSINKPPPPTVEPHGQVAPMTSPSPDNCSSCHS